MKTTTGIYIDTRICRIEKIEKGLVSFHFKGNNDAEVHEIKFLITKIEEMMGDNPFVVINDLRDNFGSFSKEVKECISNHPYLVKNKVAEALIINNLGIRIQVNFFLKLDVKNKMKYRVFKNEESAKAWLMEVKRDLID